MKKGRKANIGRNDPCPCGSGLKYKKCCLPNSGTRQLPRVVPQHIIEEDSKRIFSSHFNLKNGFLVREQSRDYGIDYTVELLNEQNQATGVLFNVQLKGVSLLTHGGPHLPVSLKKTTLTLLSRQLCPSFIVLIDTKNQEGYWQNTFDLVEDLDQTNPFWKTDPAESVTVRIPRSQDFSASQLATLTEYVLNVHKRRSAIPQGTLLLVSKSSLDHKSVTIEDLSITVKYADYDNFFRMISRAPFDYLTDANFSRLYELFEQIPPRTIRKKPIAMGVLGIAAQKKGYHQDAKKWLQQSLEAHLDNEDLNEYAKFLLNEINFIHGYITEQHYLETLAEMQQTAKPGLRVQIELRVRMKALSNEIDEATKYGRFRQMAALKNKIVELRDFLESTGKVISELVLLELAGCYLVLVPALWGEITATSGLRQKVGLRVSPSELQQMEKEALKATAEADEIFKELVVGTVGKELSSSVQAEGLFAYSLYIYHLQTVKLDRLMFLKDMGMLPDKVLLSEEERQSIEKALNYSVEARYLFNTIGAKDREAATLLLMLGFQEDLGYSHDYDRTRAEVEVLLKTVLDVDLISQFSELVKEGSFRARIIKGILSSKSWGDLDRANMSDTEIECQVDCNANTFNIRETYRINNLRKDIYSSVLAARIRVHKCRHFVLLQDRRHSFHLETLYAVEPNRKGFCQLLKRESQIVYNDAKTIIESFERAYCRDCEYREPLQNMAT